MSIVEGQKVEIKWSPSNKKWFEEKGYKWTKQGGNFLVSVEDLNTGSKYEIEIKCDCCGKVFKKSNVSYHKQTNKYRDFCYDCFNKERTQKIEVECLNCGEKLLRKPSRINKENFCNNKCQGEYWTGENNPKYNRKKVNCAYCNIEYEVKNHHYEEYKDGNMCCSMDCKNKLYGLNNRGENSHSWKEKINKECEHCGKKYEIPPNRVNRNRFCSHECSIIHLNTNRHITAMSEVVCDNCGKVFMKWNKEIERYTYNFCCKECREESRGLLMSLYGKDTKPQLMINEILNEIGVRYINEYPVKFYAVDNYLTDSDLIIEVMGDYWHVNPLKYPKIEDVNKTQRSRIKIDKAKNTYIKKYLNINVLYLWEKDINTNAEKCKKLIKEYIKNDGILEDYSSFNYSIVNNELKFNFKVSPYFTKCES